MKTLVSGASKRDFSADGCEEEALNKASRVSFKCFRGLFWVIAREMGRKNICQSLLTNVTMLDN